MASALVAVYKHAEGKEIIEIAYRNAEIHISTHGVLVIRAPNNGRVKVAYSAGTWHSATSVD